MMTAARSKNVLVCDNKAEGWRVIYSSNLDAMYMACEDAQAQDQKARWKQRASAVPEWKEAVPVFSKTELDSIAKNTTEHNRAVFDVMNLFPGSTIIQDERRTA